ncbi:hypothetical protein AHiyo1_03650 [Arthrobacter sp. Hiyo1]|nr:hypothetical protein AHiyo1_03650 [Arthrobacter sp. Hiyo1]
MAEKTSAGKRFDVWAPFAESVTLLAKEQRHDMRLHDDGAAAGGRRTYQESPGPTTAIW